MIPRRPDHPFLTGLFAILAFLAVPVLPAVAALPPPAAPPPSAEFRATAAVSSTNQPIGKWYLHFPTLAGWVYRIEESQNLQIWTTVPGAEFYGTGQNVSYFVMDGPPPYVSTGSGPPPAPASAWKYRSITLKLQTWAGSPGPNYRISRDATTLQPQGTALPAWDAILTDPLPPISAGYRRYILNDWQDEVNKIYYNIDFQVTASEEGPPGDQISDPPQAGSSPMQTTELEAYSHVKSRLLYLLGLPSNAGPPAQSGPHRYLRLRRVEQDTNQNGLPDWWEQSNQINPFENYFDAADDSDSDGLTNGEELAAGTDAFEADSDHDGATDGYEIRSGTDPLNPANYPPIFRYLYRWANFYTTYYSNPVYGTNSYPMFTYGSGITDVLQSTWQNVNDAPLYSAITLSKAGLSTQPDQLGADPAWRQEFLPARNHVIDLSVYSTCVCWREAGNQSLTRVWLEQKPAPVSPVSRTYLYRFHRTGSGIPGGDQTTATPLTFTIPAQSTDSPYQDLTPAFLDGNLYSAGQHYLQILNAEVVPAKLEWEEVTGFDNLADNKSPVPFAWDPSNSAYGLHVEQTWMPGRGKRLIVDAKAQGSFGVPRNKVRLHVSCPYQEGSGKKVYLKIFDVDDPTPEKFDRSNIVDSNGRSGADNFGSEATRTREFSFPAQSSVANPQTQFNAQSLYQVSASCEVTMPENGEAVIDFVTTAQPGDNFRAVLGFNAADLAVVQVDNPAGNGFLDSGSSPITGVTRCSASEMLTVWRELHVEMDSMPAPPAVIEAPDNVPFAATTWRGPAQPNRVFVWGNGFSSSPDFYAGGLISLKDGTSFEITSSTASNQVGAEFTLDHALTAAEANSFAWKGVVKDDDFRHIPASFGALLSRYDLINNDVIACYMVSYILLKPVQDLNTNKLVVWDAYEGAVGSTNDDSRNLISSEFYWASLLVAAFQPAGIEGSGDPEPRGEESRTQGLTSKLDDVSVVYVETCRDQFNSELKALAPIARSSAQVNFKKLMNAAAAHEIGHQPWIGHPFYDDHDEGGIMNSSSNSLDAGFTPKTIKRLRRPLHFND